MDDNKELVPGTVTPEEIETKKDEAEKAFTRAELNKILSTEKTKLKDEFKKQLEAEKTEAEKLAGMKAEEKLNYELEKERTAKSDLEKRLNARDLKDEAIKIATTQDTAFDVEFLNLFKFENMTADEVTEKTKLIKTIQDKIVEKTVNEWSKEKSPFNLNSDKDNSDSVLRTAMGLGIKKE